MEGKGNRRGSRWCRTFSCPSALLPDLKDWALELELGLVDVEQLTRLM